MAIIDIINKFFNVNLTVNDVDIHRVDNLIAVVNKNTDELYLIDDTDNNIEHVNGIAAMIKVVGYVEDLSKSNGNSEEYSIQGIARRVKNIYDRSNKSIVEINNIADLFNDEILLSDDYLK